MIRKTHSSQPHDVRLATGVVIAPSKLRWSFSRASGPGGQAVNKLNTRATLHVSISDLDGLSGDAAARLRLLAASRLTSEDEIVISAQTHRSQLDNRQACVDRLAHLVSRAMIKPKVRKKKKPTRAMIERRLESKRRTAQKKDQRRSRKTRGDDRY